MSRHSELFDRLVQEAAYSDITVAEETQTERRSPTLRMERHLRTEIEKIVNRIQRAPGAPLSKVIVFTAFEPESGCSWVCAHTGDLLAASTDATVCLADANFRNPTLHNWLEVPNGEGLADAISDPALHIRSIASKLSKSGLWILTSGSRSAEKTFCVAQSDRMRDRIAELRTSFDFVIIDAPAISISNDALVLGQLADYIVLVVRAGSTHRDTARRLTDDLVASGVRVLGAVLNDYNPTS